MEITILCSDVRHPIFPHLQTFAEDQSSIHTINLVSSISQVAGGDFLFLVSVSELIPIQLRNKFQKTLVVHGSNLPEGRGWSPIVWQILEGRTEFTLTLLEAAEVVDSGKIWAKVHFEIPCAALFDEIQHQISIKTVALISNAISNCAGIVPTEQVGDPTYYPRRIPAQSEINPHDSIANQFDLLRVCDPVRFPAYFEYRGNKFKIAIEKLEEKSD